jgi:hypothetical protein
MKVKLIVRSAFAILFATSHVAALYSWTATARRTFKPAGAIQDASIQKPSISVETTLRRSVITAGEPVRISVTVANKTDHEVSFPSRGEFKKQRIHMIGVIVRDSHGKVLPRTDYGLDISGLNSPSRKSLEGYLRPGEIYVEEYDLAREFDLTSPGAYTIEAGRRDPETNQMVMSKAIVITVKN